MIKGSQKGDTIFLGIEQIEGLLQRPHRVLPREYLSFTIDISVLMGGHWWGQSTELRRGVSVDSIEALNLRDQRLMNYARLLGPGMLRIGGTEADRVWYKPGRKAVAKLFPQIPEEPAPVGTSKNQGHEYVMTKKLWKELHRFLDKTGLDLLFTVSAGPADRDERGQWIEGNARKLMAYSRDKGYRVAAWEFGNEVNGFPFIYGWKSRVRPSQYVRDFARFGHLVKSLYPESLILGPASAVWPVIGEPYPMIRSLCKSPAAIFLDAVSWHYYPQQSSRGGPATRRAGLKTLLTHRALDGVLRWNRRIRQSLYLADGIRPSGFPIENWVTETGHALYGGEPGLSDTFLSTLWWLDELSLLAQNGVSRVFRQALVGGSYGLLDEDSLAPRPDYYASFLWKRLMGPRVHRVQGDSGMQGSRVVPSGLLKRPLHKHLRLYLHSRDGGEFTLLVINIDTKKTAHLSLGAGSSNASSIVGGSAGLLERYLLQGNGSVTSRNVLLNGVPLEEDLLFDWGKKRVLQKYRIRELNEEEQNRIFSIPPLSVLFVRCSSVASQPEKPSL